MSANPFTRGLALVLFCAAPSLAEEPFVFDRKGPATLLVHAPWEKDGFVIKLPDVLKITITVDGSKTLAVKPPDRITNSAGWRLVEVSPVAATWGQDRERWQQTYTFEPLAPQASLLQIEPFEAREDPGDFSKLLWKPIP